MEETILRVEKLGKKYGSFTALKDVSFSLYPGDILGIIGGNGAGKSTLLSLLSMIQAPTEGNVFFCGEDIRKEKKNYLSRIGYVPQEIALFEELSGYDNLQFFGKAYHLTREELAEGIRRVCKITEFPEEWLKKPVAQYSGGMKRKINIGAALLHQPEVLFLDEPVANLDFETEEMVLSALKRLAAEGTTILYVGHQMEQMEALCSKLVLLRGGRQQLFGTTEELLQKNGERITLKQLWRDSEKE